MQKGQIVHRLWRMRECAEGTAHTGGEWDEAERAFLSMGKFGYDCTPDAVTFTALISAYEKGGQWLRALGAYEQARGAGGAPRALYTLWGCWLAGTLQTCTRSPVLLCPSTGSGVLVPGVWELLRQP